MKQFLVSFQAEYYCQGYEWADYLMLVSANSFEEACEKIKNYNGKWLNGSPQKFENLTI